jgi:plasmid replication initiation protein
MMNNKTDEHRYKVVHDNQLNSTPYVLTLNEKRLMLLVISRINANKMPARNETWSTTITLSEWRQLYKTTSRSLFRELEQSCETLVDRPAIRIPLEVPGRYALANWVSYAELDRDTQSITVKLVYELLIYLQGMTEQFTKYDLLNIREIRSFYSIRLYELLAQYQHAKQKQRHFTVDEFRAIIDPDNRWPRYADLRRNVIMRGVSDINRKTNLTVDYTTEKTGNKTTGLTFHIKPKRPELTVIS